MRVLIVEFDSALSSFLRRMLEAEGYQVQVATDAEQARRHVGETEYDFLLIDVDPQQASASALVRMARAVRPRSAIVVLSSERRVECRVDALDAGADDCVPKPFSILELCARLRALRRRAHGSALPVLRVGDLELDRLERRVARCGRSIELTPKEFALLEFLMANAGAAIPRNTIIEKVWDVNVDSGTNVVDVYINYLRKKVDEGFGNRLIQTVRGVGYQLAACGQPSAARATA